MVPRAYSRMSGGKAGVRASPSAMSANATQQLRPAVRWPLVGLPADALSPEYRRPNRQVIGHCGSLQRSHSPSSRLVDHSW